MSEDSKSHIPKAAKALGTVVNPLNRFFDWLYHSKYNPIYRSGTLAVGFLSVLLITGLYLVFFYSVSEPYQSVERIQAQVWAGRWMRALHRYATDAALLAIVFHILQLLIQSKTWGPRTLAWISGVVLLGALFLSGWSGYVMVWDKHGQAIAMSGAEMFQGVPFLRDILTQAFNGLSPVTPSFFFMNLFLHVALPLVMIFGLWVHTARLSRSIWFPIKPIFYGSVLVLVILALLRPAVLMERADLFTMRGVLYLDWFYGFWVPLSSRFSPVFSLLTWTILLLILFSIPFWWRPRKNLERARSFVDKERCTGCTQCALDCPYDAISMIPRDDGKRLIAKVSTPHCVSCGICSASCDDLAVGPPGRTGGEQIELARSFCNTHLQGASSTDVVVISCTNNGATCNTLQAHSAQNPGVHVYQVECCGVLHSNVLETLLEHSGGLYLLGCPARNCYNRDGLDLLSGRIFEKRVPFLDRKIDRRRVFVGANSESEYAEFISKLSSFREHIKSVLAGRESSIPKIRNYFQMARAALATATIMFFIGYFSQMRIGEAPKDGLLRVSGRLPGFTKGNCHKPTAAEQESVPLHMRKPEVCDETILNYKLSVAVDGQLALSTQISNLSGQDDRPLFVNEDTPIVPGNRKLDIQINSLDKNMASDFDLSFQGDIKIVAGQIYLVKYDQDSKKLVLVWQETS